MGTGASAEARGGGAIVLGAIDCDRAASGEGGGAAAVAAVAAGAAGVPPAAEANGGGGSALAGAALLGVMGMERVSIAAAALTFPPAALEIGAGAAKSPAPDPAAAPSMGGGAAAPPPPPPLLLMLLLLPVLCRAAATSSGSALAGRKVMGNGRVWPLMSSPIRRWSVPRGNREVPMRKITSSDTTPCGSVQNGGHEGTVKKDKNRREMMNKGDIEHVNI